MGNNGYSYVGAVAGATYPEQGKILRKIMPNTYILVPGYGAQGGKGADLVHFFNKDGLGAIINSSRGIIGAWQQEKYAQYGEAAYADAARAAVLDMARGNMRYFHRFPQHYLPAKTRECAQRHAPVLRPDDDRTDHR
jgi:hypothetical protein